MKITIKKMGNVATPSSEADIEKWEKFSDAEYVVDMKNFDSRTSAQNRAMHLWCKQLAEILNKNELYMTGVFGNNIDWTMELVKTQIVKSTIKAVFNIDSTTELKKKEVDAMIDYVNLAFLKKGVNIPPFPSRELWED